jgi:hypothetical protein
MADLALDMPATVTRLDMAAIATMISTVITAATLDTDSAILGTVVVGMTTITIPVTALSSLTILAAVIRCVTITAVIGAINATTGTGDVIMEIGHGNGGNHGNGDNHYGGQGPGGHLSGHQGQGGNHGNGSQHPHAGHDQANTVPRGGMNGGFGGRPQRPVRNVPLVTNPDNPVIAAPQPRSQGDGARGAGFRREFDEALNGGIGRRRQEAQAPAPVQMTAPRQMTSPRQTRTPVPMAAPAPRQAPTMARPPSPPAARQSSNPEPRVFTGRGGRKDALRGRIDD